MSTAIVVPVVCVCLSTAGCGSSCVCVNCDCGRCCVYVPTKSDPVTCVGSIAMMVLVDSFEQNCSVILFELKVMTM